MPTERLIAHAKLTVMRSHVSGARRMKSSCGFISHCVGEKMPLGQMQRADIFSQYQSLES